VPSKLPPSFTCRLWIQAPQLFPVPVFLLCLYGDTFLGGLWVKNQAFHCPSVQLRFLWELDMTHFLLSVYSKDTACFSTQCCVST
jgi:hypothetical protein